MSRLTTGEMFQAGLSLSPSLASQEWDRERRERREGREGREGVTLLLDYNEERNIQQPAEPTQQQQGDISRLTGI